MWNNIRAYTGAEPPPPPPSRKPVAVKSRKDVYYHGSSSAASNQGYSYGPPYHRSGGGSAYIAEQSQARSVHENELESNTGHEAPGQAAKARGAKSEKKKGLLSKIGNYATSGYDSTSDQSPDHSHGGDLEEMISVPKSQYVAQMDEFVSMKAELGARDADIAQAKDQIAKLLHSADHMQRVMDEKELYIGGQASENSIEQSYTKMVNSVRIWTGTYCSDLQEAGLDIIETAFSERGRDICPNGIDFRSFVQDKKYRRLLVRAWICAVFCENIFPTLPDDEYGHPGSLAIDRWMEAHLAKSLQHLELKIWDSIRRGDSVGWHHLNDWRALSCNMLKDESMSRRSGAAKQRAATVSSIIEPIMSTISSTIRPDVQAEAKREFEQCVEHAINLSQQLRCHRACWYLRFPCLGMNTDNMPLYFNSWCMYTQSDPKSSSDVDSEQLVKVVIAPALFRRGNSDGVSSDVLTCQSQAEVAI